jgi:hypothetical protein
MAYAYSIATVLSLVRQIILNDFTTQGEAPTTLAYSFAAAQYSITSSSDLPLTVIEVKDGSVDRTQGVNARTFCLPVVIHHYRARVSGANSDVVALERLAHLAATIETDPRLSSLSPTVSMHEVRPKLPAISNDNAPLAAMQNVSIAHAALPVDVAWDEFLLE